MMEPLFGVTPPLWTTMAPPAWASIPMPAPGAPTVGGPVPSSSQIRMSADALGSVPTALPPTGTAVAGPTPFGAFGAAEILGPTAALVTAVAMRRGQPNGPANDAEVEDFLNDALDLVPGTLEVEVRCDGGRVTLTGSVLHKRHKRDVGEIAWAIPAVSDVQNNVSIVLRRRGRAASAVREPDGQAAVRKHA